MVERSYNSERLIFKNGGEKLIGKILIPEDSKKAYPGVLILHGFPGLALIIHDLVSALIQESFAPMIFHYRGCGGSDGKYSFLGAFSDAQEALSILIRKKEIDAKKVAIIGHSFGGLLALHTAYVSEKVKAVVALCPVANLEKDFSKSRTKMVLKRGLPYVSGLTMTKALKEWNTLTKHYDPINYINKLSPRPFLLLHGDKDDIITLNCSHELFRKAQEPKKMIVVNDSDHIFAGKRRIVVRKTVSWLRKFFEN